MVQLRTRIFERAMRMRLGFLMRSEKSSANTEMGDEGRAVPAATSEPIDVEFVSMGASGKHAFFEEERGTGPSWERTAME